jgi:hypothetical protein
VTSISDIAAVSVISNTSWLGSTPLVFSSDTKRLTQRWSEIDTRERFTK